ncbi:LysR family transcriptional regulator [Nocardia iowensis]|nr:LysR family transcriptional regulator [Nocardia iowensis]
MLHLRYFVAVAEELNFSAAARRLHMANSPLSQRIRDLEQELGQQLFDRSTHHVRLTPAGAALLPMAREALTQVNSIPRRLQEAVRPGHSVLSLGIPPAVHPALRGRVNALIERLRGRYEIQRRPGTTPSLITAVRDGDVDVALVRFPVGDPALGQLLVMSERFGALVPAARFAGRDSVTVADLADLPFVGMPTDNLPVAFERLQRELLDRGIKKLDVKDLSSEGVFEIIAGGTAFSFTILDPKSPVHGPRMDDVLVLPLTDLQPILETGLIWVRARAEGGDLQQFVDVAGELFANPLTR